VQAFVEILKATARPSSITLLVAVLAVGALSAFLRRTSRLARWYFLAVAAAYWIAGTPACAERLVEWSARDYHPLARADEARGASIVVVLGGGHRVWRVADARVNLVSDSTVFRVIEGARLYHLLPQPTIIVSGGVTGSERHPPPESEAMRDVIVSLGVPADHVVLESESKTTREEAVVIRRMLADRLSEPIVLVTSPTHMRRSLAAFRAAGFDAIPSTARYKSDREREPARWVPNDSAFELFDSFVYDTAANVYYGMLGFRAIDGNLTR
jgi:uncharacterized SAM-binding protein YcdF (DUF218 family)